MLGAIDGASVGVEVGATVGVADGPNVNWQIYNVHLSQWIYLLGNIDLDRSASH